MYPTDQLASIFRTSSCASTKRPISAATSRAVPSRLVTLATSMVPADNRRRLPREVRQEQFDGHRPIERHVSRQEHHTHPAPPDLAIERVAAGNLFL